MRIYTAKNKKEGKQILGFYSEESSRSKTMSSTRHFHVEPIKIRSSIFTLEILEESLLE
jgi:hypothetical protein